MPGWKESFKFIYFQDNEIRIQMIFPKDNKANSIESNELRFESKSSYGFHSSLGVIDQLLIIIFKYLYATTFLSIF